MERTVEDRLRAYERRLLHLANRERASRGAQEIRVDGRIARVARSHARRMAAEGDVYHNPEYRSADRFDAAYIGEIVTNGCSTDAAHENFMGSPAHRDTLLIPEWTHAGIGVASDDAGMLFVVEAFAQRRSFQQLRGAPPPSAPPRRVVYIYRTLPPPTPTPGPVDGVRGGTRTPEAGSPAAETDPGRVDGTTVRAVSNGGENARPTRPTGSSGGSTVVGLAGLGIAVLIAMVLGRGQGGWPP